MATTPCGTCSKIVLFIVNFVFWLSGIAVLGMGIWVSIDRNTMEFLKVFDYPIFRNFGFAMIGIGGFVTILGFIGCFGACHESKCLLWTYFVGLLFLFLAEIVCMALAFSYTEQVKEYVKLKLGEPVESSYTKEPTGIVRAVDSMQELLMCCGNSNHTDWQRSQWYKEVNTPLNPIRNQTIPGSCCMESEDFQKYLDCQIKVENPNELRHSQGCFDALYGTFLEYIWFIGGVGIGIAVLQVLLMVITVFLLRNLTDDYD
ncbi:tetraspanin-1-like [Patiria miniata]|uniref:Tetraspanin n=1 Tax=Patiria miniata TaxID=46514 RepID=A0A913ZMV1_PATMI|nr:tetraspanin-1-like [Patiria miniata]XP_038052689.1 tetraspanin-1-like [Patiria miniata]